MCGICGELRFDHTHPGKDRIQQMQSKLVGRGPDSEGIYMDGPLGFGHRRLAIIDLSDKSSQPMLDKKTGNAIVFNLSLIHISEPTRHTSQSRITSGA